MRDSVRADWPKHPDGRLRAFGDFALDELDVQIAQALQLCRDSDHRRLAWENAMAHLRRDGAT